MKARIMILIASMGLLLAAVPVFAHHSFAGTYFEDQDATVEGTLVDFAYRSPHSFVQLDVTDSKTGETVRWGAEWASGERLGRAGINKDTLKPGDRVIILGHPGRNPNEHRLHLQTITRPSDGWKWHR